MPKTKIKLNHRAVRDFLRSPDVADELDRRAENIAQAAGDGFAHETTIGRNRAIAMVWTDTPEARHAEATDRALTRAIDAGRG